MDLIVDRSNAQEPVELYFPGDNLFGPHERRRGLPIEVLTVRPNPLRHAGHG